MNLRPILSLLAILLALGVSLWCLYQLAGLFIALLTVLS